MNKLNIKNSYLTDCMGTKSSKRLWGMIFLGLCAIFASALAICSFFIIIIGSTTIMEISFGFGTLGGSLLGLGLADNYLRTKATKLNIGGIKNG